MTLLVNVLLVDDEPELVAVLTQRLSRRNFSVTSAPDGEGALSYLSADHAIDVVILDLKMPGIDGIENPQAHPNQTAFGGGHHADRPFHPRLGRGVHSAGCY